MQITKNFSFEEMTKTSTGIKNVPTIEAVIALTALCTKILQPLRELYGAPINVNSGFRSAEVNKAVGGVASSQHLIGEAADITAGSKAKNKKLFDLLLQSVPMYDQLIDEKNYSWIHVSHKRLGSNRKQVLHLK